MRKKLLLLFTALTGLLVIAFGQKNEFSFNINSGFYHYGGEESSAETVIYLSPGPLPAYFQSPGKKPGFSFEFSVSGQHVTPAKIIYGVELAYQSLQTRTEVVGVSQSPVSSYLVQGTGSARYTGRFVAVTPLVGYRIVDKSVRLDIQGGLELAACLRRKEEVDASTDSDPDIHYVRSLDDKRPDNRIRLQLASSFKKAGINVGYRRGITNYYGNHYIGGPTPKAYSRFIVLGVSYRL